jgi:hypothetical protein
MFLAHLAKGNVAITWHPSSVIRCKAVSEEKNFKNQPIRNKNSLWQPCLLMDRDKMSNLNRRPSIDASYQEN